SLTHSCNGFCRPGAVVGGWLGARPGGGSAGVRGGVAVAIVAARALGIGGEGGVARAWVANSRAPRPANRPLARWDEPNCRFAERAAARRRLGRWDRLKCRFDFGARRESAVRTSAPAYAPSRRHPVARNGS